MLHIRLELILSIGISILQSNCIHSSPNVNSISPSAQLIASVDDQLYSRQLAVYGKPAQQKLLDAHIVMQGSNGPATAEILKNLAMAGVGTISIVINNHTLPNNSHRQLPHLIGSERDVVSYARSLNPQIAIEEVDSIEVALGKKKATVVICAERSIHSMIETNKLARNYNCKFIGCLAKGVCGLVFDDFIEHSITDTDSEMKKEIPLLSGSLCQPTQSATSDGGNFNNNIQIRLNSIDEERFVNLGNGDAAEISLSSPLKSVINCTVINVLNPKSLVVEIDSKSAPMLLNNHSINGDFSLAGGTLKKRPQRWQLHHHSMIDWLSNPKQAINPSNGCSSPRKDCALSLTLLAAFRALEYVQLPTSEKSRKKKKRRPSTASRSHSTVSALSLFRSRILFELAEMGINKPLKPMKLGGSIGLDVIELVYERFYRSSCEGGVCPATASIIGSLTAQEAIKAVTQVHMPVNQMLVFESLDSLHPLSSSDVDESNAEISEDSQSNRKNESKPHSNVSIVTDAIFLNAVKVYGKELADELRKLRLFVVGAGAIGCELLKTLALMGIGCPNVEASKNQGQLDSEPNTLFDADYCPTDEAASTSQWKFITPGGIVITDMDTIERSNLNRQLLYRERHIGQSKANVAGQMIREINPALNILALTSKVSSDTENLFSSKFWTDYIDIVLPALDNVDARLYVDKKCVQYTKWMIDSGTLGTKGSTQVVIPFLSESYSSSADPPEEAIPLCTLKSFPYQPEHCISWAKLLFERLFFEEPSCLSDCLEASLQPNDGHNKLEKATESLNPEVIASLRSSLIELPSNSDRAIRWAIDLFHTLFVKEPLQLLKEHPLEEIDEDGVPFWGRSRKVPNAVYFNASEDTHRSFVRWAAVLRMRTFGTATRSPDDPVLLSSYQLITQSKNTTGESNSIAESAENFEKPNVVNESMDAIRQLGKDILRRGVMSSASTKNISQTNFTINDSVTDSVKERGSSGDGTPVTSITATNASAGGNFSAISLVELIESATLADRLSLQSQLSPETFEKDIASLGHVDFVASAANLRSAVYGIRAIDRLEAQRVAGNIVPAIATTTSAVAGMVCLEVVKIASERIIQRRKHLQKKGDNYSTSNKHSWQQQFFKLYRWLGLSQNDKSNNPKKKSRIEEAADITNEDGSWMEETEKDRILQRFRNAFVNMARPLFAYSQPVPAESFGIPESAKVFTLWDTIKLGGCAEDLTVAELEQQLLSEFNARLQSVTFGDLLLYAGFLPDHDYLADLTIAQLVARANKKTSGIEEDNDDDNDDIGDDDYSASFGDSVESLDASEGEDGSSDFDESESTTSLTLSFLNEFSHLDLEVSCTDLDGNDMRMPPLRVRCGVDSADEVDLKTKVKSRTIVEQVIKFVDRIKSFISDE